MVASRSFLTALLVLTALPAAANAAEYRGMTAGWPVYANGYYAANYQASPAGSPAYYVARPVAAAGYAAGPTGAMYAPTRAAYANPSYFAAYGRSPVAYRPVTTAGYAPAGVGYGGAAPGAAYYAPVTANYAPANSYAVTPAGSSSAGSEAAAYYGQPTPVNYVPPRFAYRTNYAPTPVYMYRPVTAYDPITAQPVTCLQATTSTCCQPQRSRSWFSWLHPTNWFGSGSSCGRTCGAAPVPMTSYCGTAASQCGQPYYPVQPYTQVPTITLPPNAIPALPRTTIPGTTFPSNTFPSTIPPAGTRIPPPPTGAAIPGTRTIISPADSPPRLSPGGTFAPSPGTVIPPAGSFTPGSTFTPLPTSPPPGTTIQPGGSFQTTPGTVPPTGFGPGAFGTGSNYSPQVDPYSGTTLTPAQSMPANGSVTAPSHSVFGSGFRGNGTKSDPPASIGNTNVIRAPDLGPAMPPSVQTVPDIDGVRTPLPTSSAPQLLNPRDKTANGRDQRWAVVPAVWPAKASDSPLLSEAPVVQVNGTTAAPPPQPNRFDASQASQYHDSGWKSASF